MASNEWGRGGGEGGVGREVAKVQVHKYVTKDRLLDVTDMLSFDPKRNKLGFTLVEFDENYRAKTRVRHYVDVPDFKLVCWDILHGTFAEWTDHKGSQQEDGLQARVLTLRKDVKYRQPYVLKIDNGQGEALTGGAVKMVRATESLTLLMPEWDARKMAQAVLDYVRDWETVNFRKRQEAQTLVVVLNNFAANDGHQQGEQDEVEQPAEGPAAPQRRRYARAA